MRASKGLTLIELMIVLVIVGIIAALAVPAYDTYINNSRRTDCRVLVTRLADLQERFFIRNNTYATKAQLETGGPAPMLSPQGFCQLDTVDLPNPSTFTVTAIVAPTVADPSGGPPKANPLLTDAECPAYSLNSAGVRTPAACW